MRDGRRLPPVGPRRRGVAAAWSLAPVARPGAAIEVALPCQWQTVPPFADEDGPFAYRTTFAPPPWRRVHLVAEGTFNSAEWRLNGELLGVHRGAWDEARYDLSDRLQPGPNVLEAVVACPPERGRRRRLATGVFGGWDCLPPGFQAGGIWRPVYLEAAGDVRVSALWLATERLGPSGADVVVHAVVEALRDTSCSLRLRLSPPPGRGGRAATARLALDVPAGRSRLRLPLTVDRPLPWQPWSRSVRGEADLYDLALVLSERGGAGASARRSARVGLRTVGRDREDRLVVNGQPLFVKGWNYGPSAAHLAASAPGTAARDVAAARERGLDALRVHAHVDQPALYRAADRLGVLLFQDGPLQWAYRPDAFPDAAVALRAIVDRLSAHPSVVEVRAHNEPIDAGSSGEEAGRESLGRRIGAIVGTFLWSENREVWDRALLGALGRDGRGIVNDVLLAAPHSGVIARRRGEDSHFYAGWYPQFGSIGSLDLLFRLLPRSARWLTEFGAQSVPVRETARTFMPERPGAIDWRYLGRERLAQPLLLERNVGIRELDLDRLIARTQAYQAALHDAYIDRLRSRRWRPVAGFFGFFWADATDGISWSLMDRQRRPKLAYAALKDQLQPLAAVALLPLTAPLPGRTAPIRVPVYVVNDTAWAAKVRLSVRLGAGEAVTREVVVAGESTASLGDLSVGPKRLVDGGALLLAWETEALHGTGPQPVGGSRRYTLPWPLWHLPPEVPLSQASARPALPRAGAQADAANEP